MLLAPGRFCLGLEGDAIRTGRLADQHGGLHPGFKAEYFATVLKMRVPSDVEVFAVKTVNLFGHLIV